MFCRKTNYDYEMCTRLADLAMKIKTVRDDHFRVLNLMRGFFYWLKVSILWYFSISIHMLLNFYSLSCTVQLIMSISIYIDMKIFSL